MCYISGPFLTNEVILVHFVMVRHVVVVMHHILMVDGRLRFLTLLSGLVSRDLRVLGRLRVLGLLPFAVQSVASQQSMTSCLFCDLLRVRANFEHVVGVLLGGLLRNLLLDLLRDFLWDLVGS